MADLLRTKRSTMWRGHRSQGVSWGLRWFLLLCAYHNVGLAPAAVPLNCEGLMDVVFVVDGSESLLEHDPVGQHLFHWGKMQTLLTRVVNSLPIENQYTKAALVTFSDSVQYKFGLGHHTYNFMNSEINALTPERKVTYTAGALQYTKDQMFNGARSNTRKVVVLFTDGLSNWRPNDVLYQASLLKNMSVEIHTVALTPYIDEGELRSIATSNQHYMQVHLDLMDYYADTLVSRLCRLPEPEPPTPTPPDCDLRADLVLLADNSGSIRDKNPCEECDNYRYLKDFLVSLVRSVNVGVDYTRVAAIRFSSTAIMEFYLDEYKTAAEVEEAINAFPYAGSYTNIAQAIKFAREKVFSHSRGDRPDVRNVAILVTDGESNVNETHTLYEADLAKAMGINFFVVGFTNAIDILELMSISSEPVTGHFFATADAQSLIQLQEELVRFICSSGGSRAKRSAECDPGDDSCTGSHASQFAPTPLYLTVSLVVVITSLRKSLS